MVISLEEKKGGICQINPISKMFNEVIDNLNLVDARTTNDNFTWNNKRTGDRGITCRLDHFLVLESAIMNKGELKASVLPSIGSNHWPINMEWKKCGP